MTSAALAMPMVAGRIRRCRRPGSAVTVAEEHRIWAFFRAHVGRDRAEFARSLRKAAHVVTWEDAAGRVHGLFAWSTHDTAEGPAAYVQWGTLGPALRGGARSALEIARIAWESWRPGRPVRVVFAAATVSSYLAFARHAAHLYPRPAVSTPAADARVLERVMAAEAGPTWCADRGVLEGRGRWAYRSGVVGDEALRSPSPLVRFYRRANPGQRDGDCLGCVWRVDPWTFIARGFRLLLGGGVTPTATCRGT